MNAPHVNRNVWLLQAGIDRAGRTCEERDKPLLYLHSSVKKVFRIDYHIKLVLNVIFFNKHYLVLTISNVNNNSIIYVCIKKNCFYLNFKRYAGHMVLVCY